MTKIEELRKELEIERKKHSKLIEERIMIAKRNDPDSRYDAFIFDVFYLKPQSKKVMNLVRRINALKS